MAPSQQQQDVGIEGQWIECFSQSYAAAGQELQQPVSRTADTVHSRWQQQDIIAIRGLLLVVCKMQ